MRLREYLYLAAIALAALALLALCLRNAKLLTCKEPSTKSRRFELFVLCAILGLGIAAILRNQICGTGSVTLVFRKSANDTNDQYVPYYFDLVRCARNGRLSLWNHRFGMGQSILGCQEWVMDPFNLVLVPLCLVFGEGFMSQALAITFACRAIASGLFFWRVLQRFCQTPLARILGASVFALGGYLFTEGQHYFFGTAWVLLALTMFVLERLMERQSPRSFATVAFVCAAFICSSIYSAFMTLLFSPIYVALRLVSVCEETKSREYARRLGICALAVLSGCLLSGVVLIPVAAYLFGETGRVASEEAAGTPDALRMLTTVMTPHSVIRLLSRFLGNGLISNGTNYLYQGGLNELEFYQGGLSCGIFILLGQFAHWVCTEAPKRTRAAILIGAAIVAFYCLDYFLPSILSVFRYPTYRGCLDINAVLICAMAIGFEKRFVERPPEPIILVLSSAATAFVLGWSLLRTVNGRLDCICCMAAATGVLVLATTLTRRKSTSGGIVVTICTLLVASVVADSFCAINLNPRIVSPKDFPLSSKSDTGADTEELLDYLEETDSSFYRVERSYHTWTKWNDSLSFGYRGISCYSSTEDANLSAFFSYLWPEAITHTTISFSCYSFEKDPTNPQMMSLTGIRYVISREPLKLDWLEEIHRGERGGYVYRFFDDGETIQPIYLRSTVISESEASAMTLEERRALLSTALIVDDEAAEQLVYRVSGASALTADLEEQPDGSLAGTTISNMDGIACLAVPNTEGWTVTVDGVTVPHFTANYGFIGFELPAGEHHIEAYYVPAKLGSGLAMSALGLMLTVLCAARMKRHQELNTQTATVVPAHMKQ